MGYNSLQVEVESDSKELGYFKNDEQKLIQTKYQSL
jgi:hypothetical protein